MRTVSATRRVAVEPEAAFARLAAFESAAAWDPGVQAARRLDAGDPRVGTRFEVDAVFVGRVIPMRYEIVELDAPRRLKLIGRADASTATDVIDFQPVAGGTEVTWTLDLALHGVGRLAEPFLGPVLRRLARKALDGLQADLGRLPA